MGATIATLAYVLRLTGPLNLTNTHLVLTGRGSCGGFTEGPTPGPGTDRCPDPQEQEPGGGEPSLLLLLLLVAAPSLAEFCPVCYRQTASESPLGHSVFLWRLQLKADSQWK